MTEDTSETNDDIATRDEFETALGELITVAHRNGVDPQGAWEYRHDGDGGDWEVLVTELAKREPND